MYFFRNFQDCLSIFRLILVSDKHSASRTFSLPSQGMKLWTASI